MRPPSRPRPESGGILSSSCARSCTKKRASAFTGSDLDLVLRSSGVDTLVVAGVATSAMVAATAYDAADRDFRVSVASDVCADPVDAVHEFLIGTLFPARGFEIVTAG